MTQDDLDYINGKKEDFNRYFGIKAEDNLTAFTNFLLNDSIRDLSQEVHDLKQQLKSGGGND